MEPTLTGYGCDGSGSISANRALTERQFRKEKQHAKCRQYLHNENIRRHGLNWFRLPQSAEALRHPKASATPSFSAACQGVSYLKPIL